MAHYTTDQQCKNSAILCTNDTKWQMIYLFILKFSVFLVYNGDDIHYLTLFFVKLLIGINVQLLISITDSLHLLFRSD